MDSTSTSERDNSQPSRQGQDRAGGSADDRPAMERKGWGRGAATALEKLRQRGYRGRREPDEERPSGN